MDIITHGIVVPWLVDLTYLLQLAERLMFLFTLLAIAGLAYAVFYRLLSNRPITNAQQGFFFKEGHCDEA